MCAARLPRGISREEKRGQFRAQVSYEGRRYWLGYFDSLTDARAALDVARGEVARGVFVPPSVRRREEKRRREREAEQALTIGVWVEQWLTQVQSSRKESTYREYRSTLNASGFLVEFESVRVCDVDRESLSRFLAGLEQGRGAGYRNKVFRIVRALFNDAIEQQVGGVSVSPCTGLRDVLSRVVERGIATPEQVKALAEAMPPQLSLSVFLAAWCALRQGEVLGLQRGDFEGVEDGGRVWVRVERQWNQKTMPPSYTPTKTGNVRRVSIPSSLVPLVRAHMKAFVGGGAESPVFASPTRRSVPLSQTRHNAAWAEARKQCGMEGFRFHDLRHTGLTEFARAGATARELMERGGHKDLEVAMRYQHWAAERDAALSDVLPVEV
mgnify:CR=1 FL=1